jgi:gamma-glutamyltranspeptidase
MQGTDGNQMAKSGHVTSLRFYFAFFGLDERYGNVTLTTQLLSQRVIVSSKPAATAAGIKILEQGGNAADAVAGPQLFLGCGF